jgi:hypothetical protein
MGNIVRVMVEMEMFEDVDDVNITDRITEGICDQMSDVHYNLVNVEIVD